MSDDDLIRRGDVLARLAKHGVQFGETSDAYHAVAALPAVQPAPDWPTQIDDILSNFAGRQRRLGAEFERALAEDIEKLYEGAPAQPDAAVIRKTAWNIAVEMELHAAMSTKTAAKAGAIEAAILALIDSTGKEVMPDDQTSNSTHTRPDIGPGDQAVAGAADYAALRQDIRNMVDLCEIYGEEETLAVDLESALGALSYLDAYECWNWPPPRILVEGNSIVLTWEIGNWKLYQYCDDEMQKIFRWTGTPVAGAAGPTEGGE